MTHDQKRGPVAAAVHQLRSAWAATRLLAHVRRGPLSALLAALVAAAVLPVAATYLSASVVDAATASPGTHPALSRVLSPVLLLGAMLGVQQFALLLVQPLRQAVASEVNVAFRSEVARTALEPSGIGHLDDEKVIGLLAMAVSDVQGYTPGLAVVAQLAVFSEFLSALGALAVVAWIGPLWVLLLIVVVILRRASMVWLFVGLNWLFVNTAELTRRYQYWQAFATRPEGAKETRIFGLTGWVVERYREAIAAQWQPIWRARTRVTRSLWIPLVLGGVLVWAGLTGIVPGAGGADAGRTAQYLTALLVLLGFSSATADSFDIAHGRPHLEALAELRLRLAAYQNGAVAQDAAAAVPQAGTRPPLVRFEDVRFGYPGREKPVLDGMELEIRPGEVLAVVGVNGAGKTTTSKLLTRLYEPASGRITADGTDIAAIPVDRWRSLIAVAVQGFARYDLSLRQNVCMGAPERLHDDAFFHSVSARLQVDDLVAQLPAGWDTPLSKTRSGGVDLSGGQWQRVALARALFALQCGRRILVLDEPTAHLDAEAEFEIFRTLISAADGASVLLISHRLATVRLADRIVVIRDGAVSEQGSHAELIAHGGDYAEMFALQAQQFSDDTHVGVPSR